MAASPKFEWIGQLAYLRLYPPGKHRYRFQRFDRQSGLQSIIFGFAKKAGLHLPMPMIALAIRPCAVTEHEIALAAGLLIRFFREEGFAGTDRDIRANLEAMLHDSNCWVGLAWEREAILGIATVTAMRDIEHGRLCEIGDLFVLPNRRGRGIAGQLIAAARAWGVERGCRSILVTIAPSHEKGPEDGDREALIRFYEKQGFRLTARRIARLDLPANAGSLST